MNVEFSPGAGGINGQREFDFVTGADMCSQEVGEEDTAAIVEAANRLVTFRFGLRYHTTADRRHSICGLDTCLHPECSIASLYLAWFMRVFRGDLRLVTGAYYAGERPILSRGLEYSSPEVYSYVSRVARVYRLRCLEKIRRASLTGAQEKETR